MNLIQGLKAYKRHISFIPVTFFALIAIFSFDTFAYTACTHSNQSTFSVTDPNNGRVFYLNAITQSQATHLYSALVQRFDSNYFRYNLEDGCMERASQIIDLLNRSNFQAIRVNLQTENGGHYGATGASYINGGADNGNVFLFDSLYENKTYSWGHHVTVAICVVESERDRQGRLFVLDPSTLRQAAPLETWRDQLINTLPNPYDNESWSLNFY